MQKSYLEKIIFFFTQGAKSQKFSFFEKTSYRCILSQVYVCIFGTYALKWIKARQSCENVISGGISQ
jgi:hypothetical protein